MLFWYYGVWNRNLNGKDFDQDRQQANFQTIPSEQILDVSMG